MPMFNVRVRDKRTKNEMTLSVSGQPDAASARTHVEAMPGAMGGSHPGFDVLGVDEPVATAEIEAQVQAEPVVVAQ